MSTSTARPLSAVLRAFREGATTLHDISEQTGLPMGTVNAAIDHLISMGRIEAKQLAVGCPSGGCATCATGNDDGTPGCGAPGPTARTSGPVMVQLSLKRPAR